MDANESLKEQVLTLRAVAEEVERIAANAAINTAAVSLAADNVRLAARYLEVMVRFTHHREKAAKARGAGGAG